MAILAIQKITHETRIDGRVVPNVIEITTSSGFEQINAECTVWATTRPSWADEGSAATVWASNGSNGGQIFGGEVSGFDWTYAPGKVGIICQDLLSRVREAWGGDEYEYEDQAAAAIIRNLLEKKAIPSSLANIEDSDILPNLGIVEVIVLKEGDTPYSIISSIDDLDGYRTYTTPAGTIFRRRVSGQVGTSASLTFSKGVVILGGPKRNRTRIGIVNRAIVTGLTYEGLVVGGPGVGEASAANPYVTDPSGFITETIQSNLVEDDDTALAVAERRVLDKNRRPEGIEFQVPFDPRPQPAMTIQVQHSDLEIPAALYLVVSVAHSISGSGATTTIRGKGGNLSAPVPLPPFAQFSVQLILEGQDTGSGVDAIVVAICDGSTSYDSDGTIASYAWTAVASGGTISPDSGSAAVFRTTVTSSATDITLTLTVTDTDSLTNTLEVTTPIDTSLLLVEDLYLAYGDVACSSDGEQTWKTATPASGAATCLSPIAPTYQAWGTDSGHIYATFDKLVTDLIDLGQPHGAVACTAVWIHETDPTRLWAGFDDGKVYFGAVDLDAHTAAWTLKGWVAEGPIREIRESIGAFGELRATAGQGYYYSANSGITWALQHTFDTAWRMAAGFDTNLASGLNDAAPLYDEDGTPPTLPGGVEHVRGLSFGYRVQELYAADDAANLYLGPGPAFDLSLSSDTTPAQVNHMIRSGNLDRVVYMAVGDGTGDNGFVKWIPEAVPPFFIRRTGSNAGLMIGYGSLHLPALTVTGELLIVDGGLLPYDPAGVWHYRDGEWTHFTDDLANVSYGGIAADPFDADTWLLWSQTGAYVYLTTDAGATWTQIGDVSTNTDPRSAIYDAAFSQTDAGKWMIVGRTYDVPTGGYEAHLWRGSGTTLDADVHWPANSYFGGPTPVGDVLASICSGLGGTFIGGGRLQEEQGWPQAFYVIPADVSAFGDIAITELETPGVHIMRSIDRLSGTYTVVGGYWSDAVSATDESPIMADYRTTGSASTFAHGGSGQLHTLVAAAQTDAVAGFTGGGLNAISGLPLSSTSAADATIGDDHVYGLSADRRSQTIVGIMASGDNHPGPPTGGDGYFALLQNGVWSFFLPPPFTESDQLIDSRFPRRIEVVGRP